MLENASEKAIAAKVRAMYRYRLVPADYEELMKKRTVGDVAAYLRDNTHYREVLEQANPSDIHRGQLENLLRGLQYSQYQRLIAFNFGDKKIYRYLYLREEIQQLLALLRTLSGREYDEEAERYAPPPGRWLEGNISLDLKKLAEVDSVSELTGLLGETPYGKILRRFPPNEEGQIDFVGCEQAFYTYYYQELLTFVQRELKGEARKAAREAVYRRIDHQNIVQTYRMKRFFGSDEAFIRKNLLPFRTSSQPLIDRMIAAKDVERLHALLEGAGLARPGEVRERDYIENAVLRLRARQSRWELHNSSHPLVVLYAYMTHLEIELEDIINIVESVRYGLPVEEMRKILSAV